VGNTDAVTPRGWNVFCPKAFAGIGTLEETVADRSIPIRTHRKLRHERVDRFRLTEAEVHAEPLRLRLAAWGVAHTPQLRESRPPMPEELHNRSENIWEPLVAIAGLAGETWLARAHEAAVALSAEDAPEESVGVRILRDARRIWAVYRAQNTAGERSKIRSTHLVAALNALEDAPWGSWDRQWGKELTPSKLAQFLRPYDIRPRTMRIEGFSQPVSGYEYEAFESMWAHYLEESVNNDNGANDAAALEALRVFEAMTGTGPF
jgi:putative DNA primase/helicase